jgi:hypothetical protein
MNLTPERIIELLRLEPLPEEGGMYARHYADQHSTAIFYLLRRGDFSALHRLDAPEVYHFYAGDTVQLLWLQPDGTIARPVLGMDLIMGQRPSLVVEAGVWQGSETTGEWSLVGTTMAPGFTPDRFRLGDRDALIERYPDASTEIRRLTRS